MFASHNTKARSAFITTTIAALLIAFSPNLHAQSPLTVQPSTGRVGVGNTNPAEALDVTGNIKNSGTLDVTGNIKNSGTLDVAGNIKNNGSLSVGSTAQTGTANRFRFLNSAVRATRLTAQSIVTNTLALVNFTSEEFDTDGLHDNVTNNSRLTATVVGTYLIYAFVDWTPSSSGDRGIRIEKNSAGNFNSANVLAASSASGGTGSYFVNQTVTALTHLAAGDHVEVFVNQNSGGNLNVDGAVQPLSFGMAYIGE
jgi:hypothetical protein